MKKSKDKNHKEDEWEGFDDCPVCQAMKNGKADNMEDLMKAFKEAEKSGIGKVGFGDIHENKTPIMTMRTADKNDLYYDAMDALNLGDTNAAKNFLDKALKLDSDCVQTYVGYVSLYEDLGDDKKAEENIKIAFEKILEKFSKWPKEMFWLDMDNRAYLRAIQYRADLYQLDAEKKKAIELYKLLLKLNPSDNQGIRYVLAGLYAGMGNGEISKMFDEANEKQNMNKLEKLVRAQNKIYSFLEKPKDFLS